MEYLKVKPDPKRKVKVQLTIICKQLTRFIDHLLMWQKCVENSWVFLSYLISKHVIANSIWSSSHHLQCLSVVVIDYYLTILKSIHHCTATQFDVSCSMHSLQQTSPHSLHLVKQGRTHKQRLLCRILAVLPRFWYPFILLSIESESLHTGRMEGEHF